MLLIASVIDNFVVNGQPPRVRECGGLWIHLSVAEAKGFHGWEGAALYCDLRLRKTGVNGNSR